MDAWLNYHHLRYFWTVATEGGVTRASRKLRLAPSTVSAQLKLLEDQLGAPLFVRSGRKLDLTPAGRTVFRYAERIFALGRELGNVVRHGDEARRTVVVGIADAIPKLIACRLLEPLLTLDPPVQLVCREGHPDRVARELGTQEVDVLLSDAPAAVPRVYSHFLGESSVSFFAVPALAAAHRAGFPRSLHDSPMLLPLAGSPLRRALDRWFEEQGIVPQPVGEFEDGALLNVFAQRGNGIFASLTVVADSLVADRGVELIGRVETIRAAFYALTAARDVTDPAVAAILETARRGLFAS